MPSNAVSIIGCLFPFAGQATPRRGAPLPVRSIDLRRGRDRRLRRMIPRFIGGGAGTTRP
jgi:hypothetical protein